MESTDTHTFFNGICWYCKAYGSFVQSLKCCGGCQLAVYCSRDCQKDDRSTHKYVCKELPVVDGKNVLHTTDPWEEHIDRLLKRVARLPNAVGAANPLLLRPLVCNSCHDPRRERLTVCKCYAVSYCSKKCAYADKLHKKCCSQYSELIKNESVLWNRKAYPRGLYFALLILPTDCPLLMKTLVVHVVTSNTMLDTMYHEEVMRFVWEEGFAHGYGHPFEKLNKIHFDFIVQDKSRPIFFLKIKSNKPRIYDDCQECDAIGLVITHSFQQMKYHMFFSSDEYSKPDIVGIYGNTQEMSPSGDDAIHSEISYRNMAYNPDTLVVLMDASMDLVKQGAKALNAAQPVEELVAPQTNPMRGFKLTPEAVNEKCYFTVLRKK